MSSKSAQKTNRSNIKKRKVNSINKGHVKRLIKKIKTSTSLTKSEACKTQSALDKLKRKEYLHNNKYGRYLRKIQSITVEI